MRLTGCPVAVCAVCAATALCQPVRVSAKLWPSIYLDKDTGIASWGPPVGWTATGRDICQIADPEHDLARKAVVNAAR